jgi:hypothetical protein
VTGAGTPTLEAGDSSMSSPAGNCFRALISVYALSALIMPLYWTTVPVVYGASP